LDTSDSHIRQRHALGRLIELSHQIEARQRDVETLAQATAHLTLDQGRAGEEPKPQPKLVAVIVRQFHGLGLGIKHHASSWRRPTSGDLLTFK